MRDAVPVSDSPAVEGEQRKRVAWPRLNAVLHVATAMVIARVLFLVLSLVFSNFNNGVSEDVSGPPNVLPSVFSNLSSSSSFLVDIDDGSMFTLLKLKRRFDVVVVMLYAPWCCHSQSFAPQFAETAEVFSNTRNVMFAGIDCWKVDGTCRQNEETWPYPRIVIYHTHSSSLKMEYFGKKSKTDLVNHVRTVLYPYLYVSSVEQLEAVLTKEESVLVAHFDFSVKPQPPGFMSYYQASLQATQTSTNNGLRKAPLFTVVSSKSLASKLNLSSPPSIHYFSLYSPNNRTLYNGYFSVDRILRWANSFGKVVKRFVPGGNISLSFSSPVAMLFMDHSSPTSEHMLSNYNNAIQFMSSKCTANRSLSHLSSWHCLPPSLSDKLFSLPLCSQSTRGLCPIFNPFLPGRTFISKATPGALYCQDEQEVGVVYGGWPPPYYLPCLQYFTVESSHYWSIAEGMGVVRKPTTPTLIIIDLKSHMTFSFNISEHTRIGDYVNMIESVVKGQVPLIYRSGRGQSISSNEFVHELTLDSFYEDVLREEEKVVLVFHYASWCATCTYVWPQLSSLVRSTNRTSVKLARINGQNNDLPSCHSPTMYPSVALYPQGRKKFPIWYPSDRVINSENLLSFIFDVGGVKKEETEKESEVAREEWEAVGWSLWETAEREKAGLEEANRKLNEEVQKLRMSVDQCRRASTGDKKKGEGKMGGDMFSLLDQIDGIVGRMFEKGNEDKIEN